MEIERAAEFKTSKEARLALMYKSDSERWIVSLWQKDFLGNYHRLEEICKTQKKKSASLHFDTLLSFQGYTEIKYPHLLSGRFWDIEQFQ